MANPSDKQMLRDANGDLIPQFWDITAGDFKPLTGSDGAQDTRLTGSILEEKVVDALALRDTSVHFIRAENINFKKVFLYVYSTLDVDVTFYLRPLTTEMKKNIYDKYN